MVQIGACVAAAVLGCYRFVLSSLDVSPSAQARLLDEDAHLREYVSIGTAAGIAAAFNAPIGGVLFSLEEVSTVWSARLTFRCFFASIVGAVTSNWLVSGRKHGVIEADALVVYARAEAGPHASPTRRGWAAEDGRARAQTRVRVWCVCARAVCCVCALRCAPRQCLR